MLQLGAVTNDDAESCSKSADNHDLKALCEAGSSQGLGDNFIGASTKKGEERKDEAFLISFLLSDGVILLVTSLAFLSESVELIFRQWGALIISLSLVALALIYCAARLKKEAFSSERACLATLLFFSLMVGMLLTGAAVKACNKCLALCFTLTSVLIDLSQTLYCRLRGSKDIEYQESILFSLAAIFVAFESFLLFSSLSYLSLLLVLLAQTVSAAGLMIECKATLSQLNSLENEEVGTARARKIRKIVLAPVQLHTDLIIRVLATVERLGQSFLNLRRWL